MGSAITADWGTPLSNILPKEIPWKPEDNTYGLKEANNFIGFGLTQKAVTPVKNDYVVNNDQDFYAIFEKVSDISTIVHEDWFDYIKYEYNQDNAYINYPNIIPEQKVEKTVGYAIIPKKQMVL